MGINICFKIEFFSWIKQYWVWPFSYELCKKFPNVFTDKLVTYESKIASLKLKENARPKYFLPRPLPFSMKSKVEKELERLIIRWIIVISVKSSESGTQIVLTLKEHG